LARRHDRGRRAEELVASFLCSSGLEVLGRNVRVGSLELDILAREGATLAVVEVRTRGGSAWESALGSVSALKQRRLRDAAAILWARKFCQWTSLERVRFDVAAVNLDDPAGPRIEYIKAAFV